MQDPILCLPPAQHLEGIDRPTLSDRARRLSEIFPGEETLAADPLLRARHIEPIARALTEEWLAGPPDTALYSAPERHLEFDRYFGVQRVTDADPLAALGEAMVVAYHRWLMDCHRGHSLSTAELSDLQEAFEVMFLLVTGVAAPAPAASTGRLAWSDAPGDSPLDALLRWKIGHHVFFVLIQALLLVHVRLDAAFERADLPAAREALSLSTRLWKGTTATFRYTADFPAEDYDNIVRPSMSPPFLKEGFSGFFSSDHAALIRTLKSLQPELEDLPPELRPEHRSYLEALDATYEAHALVCEAFVGAGRSLRGCKPDRASVGGPSFIRHILKSRTLAAAGHRADEKCPASQATAPDAGARPTSDDRTTAPHGPPRAPTRRPSRVPHRA